MQVRIAQLEADNAELKFMASRSEFEAAEHKARAAAHRSPDVFSKQLLSDTNQQSGGAAAKSNAMVSVGAGVTVGGSPSVSKEQQPAKIEIANDEEDVRAYAKVRARHCFICCPFGCSQRACSVPGAGPRRGQGADVDRDGGAVRPPAG